jgi:predicted MPP superfamily phosphohydrolase
MAQSNQEQGSTVKTRILIISDTHAQDFAAADSEDVFREPLPKADVLLHCGDLTMAGNLKEYESTLRMLAKIDAELKLVIAGNHDISLDKVYYDREGEFKHHHQYSEDLPEKAMAMFKGPKAKEAGITYLEEGIHSFVLRSGAVLNVCSLYPVSCGALTAWLGLRIAIST